MNTIKFASENEIILNKNEKYVTLNYLKTRRTKQIDERYFLNVNQKYYFLLV